MTTKQLISLFSTDPVNLSYKAKLLAVLASFIAIMMITWLARVSGFSANAPLLVASMGASAVLLFILPSSPLSQPWPLIGGQLISAVIGVSCVQLISETVWAAAAAVSLSILGMLVLRCLHPPGAATALAPVLSVTPLNYSFALFPVGMNALILLGMAIVLNRWLLKSRYPLLPEADQPDKPKPLQRISDNDLKHALENMDTFMDVSLEDVSKLLIAAEKNSFERFKGNITCADIMVKGVPSVEYGTEVEEAWQTMLQAKLKAMPVIDRSQRVIGIITWADFFKFMDMNAYRSFQTSLWAFIRRTPDISTTKPEAVGHIMTSPVAVISETAHIADLIPLMSRQDIRQIPVVNQESRLVGMVYQTHLIAALYDEQLMSIVNTLG